MTHCNLAIVGLLVVHSASFAADLPADKVKLQPQRWRAVRQIVQPSSEQAGFRWAMPNTVSRKAYVGNNDGTPLPAAELLQAIAKQTGLSVEIIDAVIVVHLPEPMKLKEALAAIGGQDRKATLAAISELGWSRDARAWPELAHIAVGSDIELSLAASQALRRLDGEKALDWRMHGVSADDPEFVPMAEPAQPWQVSLGVAFPKTVSVEAVEKLATSTWIPQREAAARLTACLGEKGKAICTKLATDPSPIVKGAAVRTLVAWAEPVKGPRPPLKRDGQKSWWEQPLPDLKDAAKLLGEAKDHDTMWRLLGRRVAYESTTDAIKVMLDTGRGTNQWKYMVSRPLAEWCGGPEVLVWLRTAASESDPYRSIPGWALWGLSAMQDGDELAKSLQPALEGRAMWAAPPEFNAASGAGRSALPSLMTRMEQRGQWVCTGLGHIGGPEAVETLIDKLDHKDPGVAVAAAKGLGDTAAIAGVKPLIVQLKHENRLRRHWAVLGLGKIGGPDASAALVELLREEEKRKDRLVRKAAAELLKEIGPLSEEAKKLIAAFEEDDRNLVPEYRPRNARFDDSFPENTEVAIKEHKPVTYCSIGETRAAMDWANRLIFRYGGCTPCYSNEFFAFDVGTATWFPIRAADQYCDLFNEQRPNPGCSRGMTFDGTHKWVWIGQGIGGSSGPTQTTHNRGNGLCAYDAALDRFYPCENAATMAKSYRGEPAKMFAFNSDAGLVIGSVSGGQGISTLDTNTLKTAVLKAPDKMPSWEQYRPPAFAFDPVSHQLIAMHPDLDWKALAYDRKGNSFTTFAEAYPGEPSKQIMGGLVFDSLNKEMIVIGGAVKDKVMPTCRLDREKMTWVDLKAKDIGKLGVGMGTCVYDPEHNVVLEVWSGAAYRFRNVPVGTKGAAR